MALPSTVVKLTVTGAAAVTGLTTLCGAGRRVRNNPLLLFAVPPRRLANVCPESVTVKTALGVPVASLATAGASAIESVAVGGATVTVCVKVLAVLAAKFAP